MLKTKSVTGSFFRTSELSQGEVAPPTPFEVEFPALSTHWFKLPLEHPSIMPTLITGHTNAATIMIGEKAADLIKAAN